MPVATFTKFNCFAVDKHHGKHNFDPSGGHVYKVMLTTDTPSPSGDAVKADLTETAASGGYSGPVTVTITSSEQVNGTYKLVIADPPTWTGSGAGFDVRAVPLYNDTTAGKPLVGFWDYGSLVTVGDGETFRLDLDPSGGVFTST